MVGVDAQITRYLLPILPLAAVLAAFAGVRLWSRGRATRALVALAGFATALPLLAITGLYGYQVGPAVVGAEAQGHFLNALRGTTMPCAGFDTRLPPGKPVLVGGVHNLYWLDRPYVSFSLPLFAPGDSGGAIVARMRRYDVSYVAVQSGVPPPVVLRRSRLIAALDVPVVSSRTLARVSSRGAARLRVVRRARPSAGC